jgi:hypothetical protein
MSPDTILIPLSYLVAVGSPVIGALVAAIVWLAKAKDRAEQGRLDDLRASSQVVRETQERALPLLDRVATEMRLLNEYFARRLAMRAAQAVDGDSEPPGTDNLEDTLTRLQRGKTKGGTRNKVPQ